VPCGTIDMTEPTPEHVSHLTALRRPPLDTDEDPAPTTVPILHR
jgi:hypothetical protein